MGKKHVYTLSFTLTEIQVRPTVANWDAVPVSSYLP